MPHSCLMWKVLFWEKAPIERRWGESSWTESCWKKVERNERKFWSTDVGRKGWTRKSSRWGQTVRWWDRESTKKSGENEKPQVSPQINFQNSLLHLDFKIIEQVGEVEQKEKLFYISLIGQIEVGLEKGYFVNEVVHAVINAISLTLSIWSYLEG